MAARSPIREWRTKRGMTRAALAKVSGLLQNEIARIEAGREGLPGELQDYLTQQGESVSQMTSDQSSYIASKKR